MSESFPERPKEPTKPVSTRRNLTENLGFTLNSNIKKVVTKKSRIAVQNIKHILNDPGVADELTLTAPQDSSVRLGKEVAATLKRRMEQRKLIVGQRGSALKTKSKITQTDALDKIKEHMDLKKGTTEYYK